jgi:hypothetical protein
MRIAALIGVVVAGLMLFGLAAPATAAPSLGGYTGLLLTPTADALDRDEYNLGFFALNLEEGGDENVYVANLGLADGVEVGVARVKPEEGASETFVNAKYRIRPEDGKKPALAAGVMDATDELETSVYFVMSQSLSTLLKSSNEEITNPRLHLGVGGGRLKGLFAGASVALGDTLSLMAEYDTDDINLGARLAVGHGFRAHAGWLNGLDDFAIGASFNKMF